MTIIAVDTETTGLNPYKGDKVFLVSVAWSSGKKKCFFMDRKKDVTTVRKILKNEKYEKVFHNAKFDIKMLQHFGFTIKGVVHDTLLMSRLLNTTDWSHGLKYLSKKYFKEEYKEEELIDGWFRKHKILKADRNYKDIPKNIIIPYAIKDVWNTLKLYYLFKRPIWEDVTMTDMYNLEMTVMRCLVDVEDRGVYVDVDCCKRKIKLYTKRLNKLEKRVYKKAGCQFNILSPKQLSNVCVNKLKLPVQHRTEKGNPSFGKIAAQKSDSVFLKYVEKYRTLHKMIYTYLYPLKENAIAGKIHCNFNQSYARTGRFSSSDPNLQNIPRDKRIRRVFTCRPDYYNFYFDFDQIEMRLFAHYSQDSKMLKGFNTDPDYDIHRSVAAELYEKNPHDVTDEERRDGKTLNFGKIYGIGAQKASLVYNEPYHKMKRLLHMYDIKYPSVRALYSLVRQKLGEKGYLEDVFGRQYYVPLKEYYKGVNYLIQGCAGNIFKKALTRVADIPGANVIMLIHDEIVIELHKNSLHLVDDIHRAMEDFHMFLVPIKCSVEYTTDHWGNKREYISY